MLFSSLKISGKCKSSTCGILSVAIIDENSDILSLAQKLNLVVPTSVKKCRTKKEALSSGARNSMVKSSLIILQAAIGRNKPSQSEFELGAQQIIMLVPELKEPMPPIRQDASKQWVFNYDILVCIDSLAFSISF